MPCAVIVAVPPGGSVEVQQRLDRLEHRILELVNRNFLRIPVQREQQPAELRQVRA
jgi:hypothetical protein